MTQIHIEIRFDTWYLLESFVIGRVNIGTLNKFYGGSNYSVQFLMTRG